MLDIIINMNPRTAFNNIFTDSVHPGENILDLGSGTALLNADDIKGHQGDVLFDLGLSEEEVVKLADEGREKRDEILKRINQTQIND